MKILIFVIYARQFSKFSKLTISTTTGLQLPRAAIPDQQHQKIKIKQVGL